MSLIFEALKKGHAPAAVPLASSAQQQPASVLPETVALPAAAPVAASALSSQVLALIAGMLLAGAGAWLYWAGRASNNNAPAAAPVQVAQAPMQAPAPTSVPVAQSPTPVAVAPAPVILPAATVVAVPVAPAPAPQIKAPVGRSQPASKSVAAAPAADIATVTPAAVAVPASAAPPKTAVAAPAVVAETKPAPRPPINTQVQLSVEPNPFDVREVFQNFVQLLQTGQLPEAQLAADKISGAMGRNHVMSLRAQGYLALKKGDLAQAKGQYLLLHQLLPEDRESGLNLALIEWRLGDKDSAARRVARLLEKFPNDQEIQALSLNVRSP